jgi:hypothetical protein
VKGDGVKEYSSMNAAPFVSLMPSAGIIITEKGPPELKCEFGTL